MISEILQNFVFITSFSGSIIAFAKLQGLMKKSLIFSNQQILNLLLFIITLGLGAVVIYQGSSATIALVMVFFGLALLFGILMTLPIECLLKSLLIQTIFQQAK